jgi:hypothetical protein
MKTVFSSSEIPHLWAHKTQSTGRNAQGNLYFENDSIFSYGRHYEIARHVQTKQGNAVLLNCESNSVTTNGQVSAVRQAIPPDVQVFCIPELTGNQVSGRMHEKTLKYYASQIEKHLLLAVRARSIHAKESNHETAQKLTAERNQYVRFFHLRLKPLADVPALDSDQLEQMKKKEAKRLKAETAKAKQARAERLLKLAGCIQDWRNGIGDSWALPYDVPTMLRINGDEIETSKGAKVPMSHAKRALTLVRAVISRGESWQTNGHTCHVGNYKLDRIETDGTLKAGCHVIARNEWELIAPALEAYQETETASRTAEQAAQ